MTHQESSYTVEDDTQVGELLELLTAQHCRPVLRYLRESTDGVAPVSEIANEINGRDPERVAIRLHHSTLPRLKDAGVIDYDTRTDIVRYQGHSDLERLLDAIRACGDERERVECDCRRTAGTLSDSDSQLFSGRDSWLPFSQ